MLTAIWKRFAPAARNATRRIAINRPRVWRTIFKTGWTIVRSSRVQRESGFGRAVGRATTAGLPLCFWPSVSWARVRSSGKFARRKFNQPWGESVLTARSVAVLPFYDLDTATADRTLTQAFAASLQEGLTGLGPARVTILEPGFAVSRNRIGELIKEGRENRNRTIITGTTRMMQGRQRISFQLIDRASKETLFSHMWEPKGQGGSSTAIPREVTQAIYSILRENDWSDLIHSRWDPGLRNEAANEAMTAGRLIVHSSTSDCDKAIGLFTKALEIEPNSSLAHAYLSVAETARTHFVPDRSSLEIGKQEAETALRLSPGSPEAHQALAGVYYQEGRFSEALEQGLETLEMGGLRDRVAMLLGMTLDMLGRPHQALGWNKLASQLAATPGKQTHQSVTAGPSWWTTYKPSGPITAP